MMDMGASSPSETTVAFVPDGIEPQTGLDRRLQSTSVKRKWRWPNYIHIGPVHLRVGSRYLAAWGFPRVQIGGVSLWSWTNSGDLHFAAYHPRRSITWLWYVGVMARGRGCGKIFSRESREHMAKLHAEGNPYASEPRWFHRFWQPAKVRRSQWHHYARLPFGFALVIGRQEAMWR